MKAFSEKKYITLNELKDLISAPLSQLKEVLKGHCNYLQSGPNRSSYELKKEFQM